MVDDLDGGRQLVGIDPDDHARHGASCTLLEPVRKRRGGQCCYELGQSPLEPRLVTVPDEARGGPPLAPASHELLAPQVVRLARLPLYVKG
ncbi:hypothetical protein GCM10009817_25580 [Terrabacter lapilli]|uniref:Uncharacterized protein n=1 Tax=Terrabacter lapilli TaxID=436231 RepID=A0ABN2SAW6_9MICO